MNGFQQEGFGAMDMIPSGQNHGSAKMEHGSPPKQKLLTPLIFPSKTYPMIPVILRPDGKRGSTWECYLKPLMHPQTPEDRVDGSIHCEAQAPLRVETGGTFVKPDGDLTL